MKYDKDFKLNAIQLSEEIGVKKAADQLGLAYSTLSTWRSRANKYAERAFIGSGNSRKIPTNEKDCLIYELRKKIKEVEKANDILKDALGFFATSRKK